MTRAPRTAADALPSPVLDSVLAPSRGARLEVLDGWRAASILLVIAGHWLPIGPARWQLNEGAAAAGMALFFTLSGFLIVRLLLLDPRLAPFLIRRFFRVVPLAWTAMLVLACAGGGDRRALLANLLFLANLPPYQYLMPGGHHFWSLCVEAQFYLGIAGLVALVGRRGLWLLPAAALAITAARIAADQPVSIATWHRADEILAGGTLALLYARGALAARSPGPAWLSPVLLLATVLSTSAWGGPLIYARPYLAAAAVGASFVALPAAMRALWCSRPARYVADISYALYVFHGMLTDTWLGSGDKAAKYLKRPLLIAATWALAHASTRWLEAPALALGKKLARVAEGRGVARD